MVTHLPLKGFCLRKDNWDDQTWWWLINFGALITKYYFVYFHLAKDSKLVLPLFFKNSCTHCIQKAIRAVSQKKIVDFHFNENPRLPIFHAFQQFSDLTARTKSFFLQNQQVVHKICFIVIKRPWIEDFKLGKLVHVGPVLYPGEFFKAECRDFKRTEEVLFWCKPISSCQIYSS